MTGVLLVNMGGARSQREMKSFLSNMFKDPHILPFGPMGRSILSWIISNVRYKKSWKKYVSIGGTPIIDATQHMVEALQKQLGWAYRVKMAFSYSKPFLEESLVAFKNEEVKVVKVVPLYPQPSLSTTQSVVDELDQIQARHQSFEIQTISSFYHHPGFVKFWTQLIRKHLIENGISNPYFLFSAHSIPQNLVSKGDSYPRAIQESASLIANNLGFRFEVAYQSSMRAGKWIGPDVLERLKILARELKDPLVLIPISFVNENLETLYDMDKVIIPFCKNELQFAHVSRVTLPDADETFVQLLADLLRNNT